MVREAVLSEPVSDLLFQIITRITGLGALARAIATSFA